MNIILIGMMGSGKSTIGKVLSKKLDYQLIDTDEVIEKTNNMLIKDIFEIHGESHFRKLERDTFLQLSNLDNSVVSTGGGAVLNETLKPFNGQNIIYLKWSIAALLSNLTSKVANRPLLDDNLLDDKLISIFDVRKELYEGWARHVIDCDNKSVEDVVALILELTKESISD